MLSNVLRFQSLAKWATTFWLLFAVALVGRTETVIDVLIVYTPAVESDQSGRDGVVSLAQVNISSANMGFENSDLDIRLRLKAVEKVEYEESATNMSEDLEFITNSSSVASLRQQLGADVVCLLRHGPVELVAGIAWKLENPDGEVSRAYSVVSAGSSVSNLTFQHEIGHNLGAAHDRENSVGPGLYSYSYGHRFLGSNSREYRTIMAYEPGRQLNVFSNPDVTLNGGQTGVTSGEDAADIARTFRQSGPVIESYYEHIHVLPVAQGGVDRGAEDWDEDGFESLLLDASDSSSEEGIESWEWSWPGGSATGESVTADFPLGETLVTLTIIDTEGYQDTDNVSIFVFEKSPFTMVETGYSHGLFVKSYGSVWGVGRNGNGQLGNGNGGSPTLPQEIFSMGVKSVSAHLMQTLVVRIDGSLWALGGNRSGQLGDGTLEDRSEPVEILSSGVSSVSAGFDHSLVLMEDGSVWAMGWNGSGQLADGTFERRLSPVKTLVEDVIEISAGYNHSLFLKENGSLWAAGKNFGDDPDQGAAVPVEVFSDGVRAISASGHSLIVMEDGSLWAMGDNNRGQLGDGTTIAKYTPIKIVDTGVVAASAGGAFSLVLKDDGSLWHSGIELFDDAAFNSVTLRKVIGGGVSFVSAGYGYALVLRDDASVWAIGANRYGELGNGEDESSHEMVKVFDAHYDRINLSPIADAGPDLTFPDGDGNRKEEITLDGSASFDDWQPNSWHWSWEGGTASGKVVEVEFPEGATDVLLTVTDDEGLMHSDSVKIVVRRQSRIKDIACGFHHSLVLKRDGSLWVSGNNRFGQIGLAVLEEARTLTLLQASGVRRIATGLNHSLFVKDDGSLWGMGPNLDVGSQNAPLEDTIWEPAKIVESGVHEVFAGEGVSFFLKEDGSLWAFGNNQYGRLGDGTNENRYGTPVAIFLDEVVQVSTSKRYTLFLKSDGSLWATGQHRLGNGIGESFIPEEVISSGVSNLSSNGTYSLILIEDGSLYWIGSIRSNINSIVSSEGLEELIESGIVSVSAEEERFYLEQIDGTFLVGTGAIGNRIRFSQTEFSDADKMSSGVNHTLFAKSDSSLWGIGENRGWRLGLPSELDYVEATEVIQATGMYDFDSWLQSHFSDSEIAAMGEGAATADPDLDGVSNIEEKLFGLSPKEAYNPFDDSALEVNWEGDGLSLEYGLVAPGLRYFLWASDDMKTWQKLTLPQAQGGSSIGTEISNRDWRFYKIEISE